MVVITIILGATNLYLIKKLHKRETRKEIAEAQKLIKRNRKILIDQYLALGTLK